jgi:hypothetical protein
VIEHTLHQRHVRLQTGFWFDIQLRPAAATLSQLNHVLSAHVADWVSASEEIKPNFKIVQAQPTIVLHVPHVTVSTEADHAAKVIVECTVASLGESITNEQSHWPAASQKSEVRVLLRLERY